jgi:hypothetical protein
VGNQAHREEIIMSVVGGYTITEAAPGAFDSLRIHAPEALAALGHYLADLGLTATDVTDIRVGFRFESRDTCRQCHLQQQRRAVAEMTVTGSETYAARVDYIDCDCGQRWD